MLICAHPKCRRAFPPNPSRPTKRFCSGRCRYLDRHRRYRERNREMIADKRRRARLHESDCSHVPGAGGMIDLSRKGATQHCP